MRRLALAAAVVAGFVVGGCWHGSESDSGEPATDTAFGFALATVGGAAVPVGTGYGWIDARALPARRLDAVASALGPTGSRLLRDRGSVRRRTGLDLGSATALLATATSYTTGIRADGVDAEGIRARLERGEPDTRQEGEWTFFDFGRVSSVRFDTPVEVLEQLGPRVALGADSFVGATRDQTRLALTGTGDSPLEDPAAALAVACLGEVVAARIVPNNFTHWPGHGPDLLALGVADGREVMCAIDRERERVGEAVSEMRAAFAPNAEDAVTGERMGELIAGADVDLVEGDGAFAARAELVPATGRRPGFVFAAFVRGSALTYLGLPPLRVGTPGR